MARRISGRRVRTKVDGQQPRFKARSEHDVPRITKTWREAYHSYLNPRDDDDVPASPLDDYYDVSAARMHLGCAALALRDGKPLPDWHRRKLGLQLWQIAHEADPIVELELVPRRGAPRGSDAAKRRGLEFERDIASAVAERRYERRLAGIGHRARPSLHEEVAERFGVSAALVGRVARKYDFIDPREAFEEPIEE